MQRKEEGPNPESVVNRLEKHLRDNPGHRATIIIPEELTKPSKTDRI